MKHLIPLAACALLATVAAQAKPKIAFVGLLHSHCWRQLENVKTVSEVELVGIAESNPELVAEAKEINPGAKFFDDCRRLTDQQKPDIVWAFAENNRHLEILEIRDSLALSRSGSKAHLARRFGESVAGLD